MGVAGVAGVGGQFGAAVVRCVAGDLRVVARRFRTGLVLDGLFALFGQFGQFGQFGFRRAGRRVGAVVGTADFVDGRAVRRLRSVRPAVVGVGVGRSGRIR